MEIIIALISILAISGLVWLANKFLPFQVCPICAGVSATWLLIIAGVAANFLEAGVWLLVAGILMGGSVVGIAYQAEKRLPAGRSALAWKVFFIPFGFAAAYSLIQFWWLIFAGLILVLLAGAVLFFYSRQTPDSEAHRRQVESLKAKMEDCC
jgi:hypothetical protein